VDRDTRLLTSLGIRYAASWTTLRSTCLAKGHCSSTILQICNLFGPAASSRAASYNEVQASSGRILWRSPSRFFNCSSHPDLPPVLLAARPHSNSLTLPFFSTFSFVTMLFWSISVTCIRSPSRMSTLSLSNRGQAHLFVTLPSGSKSVQSVVVIVTLHKRNRSLSNQSV
jgi:hypothetical protein